jgi:hypothetical protein
MGGRFFALHKSGWHSECVIPVEPPRRNRRHANRNIGAVAAHLLVFAIPGTGLDQRHKNATLICVPSPKDNGCSPRQEGRRVLAGEKSWCGS